MWFIYYVLDCGCFILYDFLCILVRNVLILYRTTSAHSYKRVVNRFSVLLCSEILWVAQPVHINH